jgi:predicted phosphodiesterase
MRYAIFGDIHANLEALNAVLRDAEAHDVTHYVCLGDVVGYNANPHECVEIVQRLECPVVKGNHDEMASLEDDLTGFNPLAEEAINWTRQQLTPEDKQWLRDLKMVRTVSVKGGGDFTIVHATLDTPHKWGYVFNQLDAAASFNYQHTQLCFYGHTHSPRAYIRDGSVRTTHLEKLQIEPGKKYFINVGSVGQPRDGDWHAAYCLYTPGSQLVELRRLDYEIGLAQDKIVDAGLPQRLADRLALGK